MSNETAVNAKVGDIVTSRWSHGRGVKWKVIGEDAERTARINRAGSGLGGRRELLLQSITSKRTDSRSSWDLVIVKSDEAGPKGRNPETGATA